MLGAINRNPRLVNNFERLFPEHKNIPEEKTLPYSPFVQFFHWSSYLTRNHIGIISSEKTETECERRKKGRDESEEFSAVRVL